MRLALLFLLACAPRATTLTEPPGTLPGDEQTHPPAQLSAFAIIITEPADGAVIDAESVVVRGTADGRAQQIFVRVGPNAPLRASSDDGFRTWQVSAPLGVGGHAIVAEALSTSDTVHVIRPSAAPDDGPPSLVILGPTEAPKYQPMIVSGTASDDRAVVRMEVSVNGVSYGNTETSDFYAHWFATLELAPGSTHTIVISAWDDAGHMTQETLVLQLPSVQDRTPPEITLLTPEESVDAERVTVTGTAYDAGGISAVKVYVDDVTYAALYDPVAGAFSVEVPLAYGETTIRAKAIDSAGLSAVTERVVTNARMRQWSDEQLITLRDRSADPRPRLSLSLNETALKQLIDLPTRKQIKVLDIDPTPLLENALWEIMTACGTHWQADTSSPTYDCNLTALGQSFGAPEHALLRLLTMTPINVDVDGTSIDTLAGIATAIGLGGGFGQLLAMTLGISRTTPVVPPAYVAQALKDVWMGSHPAVNANKTLPITLHDVLEDMAPLGTTFGPVGAHPGVLDPSQPPSAILFGPATAINLGGTSNLRWMDGVRLGIGKDYFARPDQPKLINLDFDHGFAIANMVTTEPKLDLRFRVFEDPSRIGACTGNGCKDNVPGGNPRGIWSVSPWLLESVINHAAYLAYHTRDPDPDRVYNWNILLSSASITVQNTAWAKGWAVITAKIIGFDLGAPEPQYLWELIDEVAQRRLHYPIGAAAIAEGNANVAFTLKQVPTGLTEPVIVNGVREQLRLQEQFLIDRMLGNWRNNNGAVDFYYRDGKLEFIRGDDPRQGGHAYAYTAPGFSPNSDLSGAVMSFPVTGDHVLYAQGQDGATYRLRVHAASGRVDIRVAKRL